MGGPIPTSSRSEQVLVPEEGLPAAQPARDATREPWAKRLLTKAARRAKGNGLLFPTFVHGFRLLQGMGINVTPNHFYWPVPDVAELERREWPIYATPPGCNFRMREQIELAKLFASRYVPELDWDERATPDSYHYQNGYFESCDAEVAYCMVRHWKPRRIIEIGSGYSTRVLAHALRVNRERDRVAGELLTV
ncbi:MAG: hypothetical protein J2P13_12275, partial [Acidobacteria bacterium]|nr:hypothetical protein [Acidobacteriota bacterium]